MKGHRVAKNFKATKSEPVFDELESKASFQRQQLKKYLRLTLVFM